MPSLRILHTHFITSFHSTLIKECKERTMGSFNYFAIVVTSDTVMAISTFMALYFAGVSTNWKIRIPSPLYQIVGLLPLTYSFGILHNLAEAFISERTNRTLDLILSTPCSRAGFVLGKAMATVLLDTVRFLLAMTAATFILLLSGFLPTSLNLNINIWSFIISTGLSILSLYGVGLILSAFGLARREFAYVHPIINTSIFFLSGYLYPVKYLPPTIQSILYLFPFAHAMESIRNSVINGASINGLIPHYTVMAIYAALTPVALIIFKHIEHNAKITGKLYEV